MEEPGRRCWVALASPPESAAELDGGAGPGSWIRGARGQGCGMGSLYVRWKRVKH